jgi:hypothetical protein
MPEAQTQTGWWLLKKSTLRLFRREALTVAENFMTLLLPTYDEDKGKENEADAPLLYIARLDC